MLGQQSLRLTFVKPRANDYTTKQLILLKGTFVLKLCKIRDTRGTFHAKMGLIKDRNGRDPTEAEDIKKTWQEYTEELYKKVFTTQIITMV